MELVLKTSDAARHRGFESLSLRQELLEGFNFKEFSFYLFFLFDYSKINLEEIVLLQSAVKSI